jgi:hypothetical protein
MWSCSRRGFPSTPGHPGIWWALTPPFHPCPYGRSSFLWHCPWGRPLSRFGTALPCGARTFLPLFPGSNHLTRSESFSFFTAEDAETAELIHYLLDKKPVIFKLSSAISSVNHFSFSSIALFAKASASLFISLLIYCTVTLPIFPINSFAFPCSGFRPSFFTL